MNIASFVNACCCFVLLASLVFASDGLADEQIPFNDHIRPILSEYCFACHGPDAASREAELRLDTRDGAMDSASIVPGSASDSDLIERINSNDPDIVMPPPDFHKRPNAKQRQLLARWIDAGAQWEKHWSTIVPSKSLGTNGPKLQRVAKSHLPLA